MFNGQQAKKKSLNQLNDNWFLLIKYYYFLKEIIIYFSQIWIPFFFIWNCCGWKQFFSAAAAAPNTSIKKINIHIDANFKLATVFIYYNWFVKKKWRDFFYLFVFPSNFRFFIFDSRIWNIKQILIFFFGSLIFRDALNIIT